MKKIVAFATPTYWAVSAYRAIFLQRASLIDIAAPSLILATAGLAMMPLAGMLFRADEMKDVLS